jgi:hypothetical protein
LDLLRVDGWRDGGSERNEWLAVMAGETMEDGEWRILLLLLLLNERIPPTDAAAAEAAAAAATPPLVKCSCAASTIDPPGREELSGAHR